MFSCQPNFIHAKIFTIKIFWKIAAFKILQVSRSNSIKICFFNSVLCEALQVLKYCKGKNHFLTVLCAYQNIKNPQNELCLCNDDRYRYFIPSCPSINHFSEFSNNTLKINKSFIHFHSNILEYMPFAKQ